MFADVTDKAAVCLLLIQLLGRACNYLTDFPFLTCSVHLLLLVHSVAILIVGPHYPMADGCQILTYSSNRIFLVVVVGIIIIMAVIHIWMQD